MIRFNPIAGGIREFMPFPKGINRKVNVIVRLEFELAYFEATFNHVSHYAIVVLDSEPDCQWWGEAFQVRDQLTDIKVNITMQLSLFTPLEFFTSVLTDGFSLEFEWQQVFSSLQDSSQDSGRSQLCCHLDCVFPSANFQVLQTF